MPLFKYQVILFYLVFKKKYACNFQNFLMFLRCCQKWSGTFSYIFLRRNNIFYMLYHMIIKLWCEFHCEPRLWTNIVFYLIWCLNSNHFEEKLQENALFIMPQLSIWKSKLLIDLGIFVCIYVTFQHNFVFGWYFFNHCKTGPNITKIVPSSLIYLISDHQMVCSKGQWV